MISTALSRTVPSAARVLAFLVAGCGAVEASGIEDSGRSPALSDGGGCGGRDAGCSVDAVRDAGCSDCRDAGSQLEASGPTFACGPSLQCASVRQYCLRTLGTAVPFYGCGAVPPLCLMDVEGTQGVCDCVVQSPVFMNAQPTCLPSDAGLVVTVIVSG